jgi:putative MATE family efflux protein
MEYINPLGEEKVSKLLLKFSVPAIVGMTVNALYNVVDRIFIGNSSDLGSYGLAGITIGFPIMIILMATGILFGIGGVTLFSIRLGEKQHEEAENVLGNTFVLLVISGFVFMILGQIFLRPLLSLFGASEAVLPYSMEYMRVIFFGAIFQIVSMGMNNFIRADGNPKIAMLTMFLGAGINTILDPIFIYVLRMGMTGAALATILAQLITTIWVISYFTGKRSRNKLKLKFMKLKSNIIVKITSLGLPGFLLQLASSLLNVLLNKNLLIYGGDIAVSGMGIINSLQTILLMPIIGINQGAQPIISFNFGAKKYNRVKTAVKIAIIAATAIVIIGFIVTRFFSVQMISFFTNDPELLEFGSYALLSWFLFLPVIGFQIICSNFFQAIGKSKSAMFLTLTRQLIFLIPAVIIFPRLWGVKGLLHAAPFADLLSVLLTGIWFYYGIKNLGKDPVKKVSSDLIPDAEAMLSVDKAAINSRHKD